MAKSRANEPERPFGFAHSYFRSCVAFICTFPITAVRYRCRSHVLCLSQNNCFLNCVICRLSARMLWKTGTKPVHTCLSAARAGHASPSGRKQGLTQGTRVVAPAPGPADQLLARSTRRRAISAPKGGTSRRVSCPRVLLHASHCQFRLSRALVSRYQARHVTAAPPCKATHPNPLHCSLAFARAAR